MTDRHVTSQSITYVQNAIIIEFFAQVTDRHMTYQSIIYVQNAIILEFLVLSENGGPSRYIPGLYEDLNGTN